MTEPFQQLKVLVAEHDRRLDVRAPIEIDLLSAHPGVEAVHPIDRLRIDRIAALLLE